MPLPAAPRTFEIGDSSRFSKTITESDVSTYAGLVGDFHPLHVDAEYARKSRYGRRTAPAMLVAGLIGTVLHNHLPGQCSVELSQRIECLAPVFIGDTVTARVEVINWQPEKRLLTLQTECFNQENLQVITGQAAFMIVDDEISAENERK
ncbi:MAG TPA: MaoC family dehydratase [Anaerolineaceae bacterium]